MSNPDIILNHLQIRHKIKRLAWQVFENNMDEIELWIAGLDQRGMYIAQEIALELKKISNQKIQTLHISPGENQDHAEINMDFSSSELSGKVLILVDDVLNTGKTILNAMLPLWAAKPKSIQVMVLASRSHRLYPVRADYVGISMATTLQEHLHFNNDNVENLSLTLN